MEGAKLIGLVAGIMLIIGPVIKWLISDWFRKSKEIQELKRSQTRSALMELRENIKSINSRFDTVMVTLNDNNRKLDINTRVMKDLQRDMEDTVAAYRRLETGIREEIKTSVKSEIFKLSERLVLIRNKKNGQ